MKDDKPDDVVARISFGESFGMWQCLCGAVGNAHGSMEDIREAQAQWDATHVCRESPAMKIFWLSFCDAARPVGTQFLGACLIEVTAEEADTALIDVALRFPFAQEGAEWLAAAMRKAHELGCNPGGEVASLEIPADHPMLVHFCRGVLMDRATIERIDAEVEKATLH